MKASESIVECKPKWDSKRYSNNILLCVYGMDHYKATCRNHITSILHLSLQLDWVYVDYYSQILLHLSRNWGSVQYVSEWFYNKSFCRLSFLKNYLRDYFLGKCCLLYGTCVLLNSVIIIFCFLFSFLSLKLREWYPAQSYQLYCPFLLAYLQSPFSCVFSIFYCYMYLLQKALKWMIKCHQYPL